MDRSHVVALFVGCFVALSSCKQKSSEAAPPGSAPVPATATARHPRKPAIERSTLATMFERMGRDGIDTKQDLLWGYFFTDSDPRKLRAAVPALEAAGYRFVEVLEPGGEPVAGEGRIFSLHVERVERHDVDSLDARNQELDRFAAEHDLLSYDGMDVGRVDGRPFSKPR